MDFRPSAYQAAIFDFVRSGEGNAVVEAVAGSGKTTTIVESMKLLAFGKRALFLAFNKAIADVLRQRCPRNATASTFNSFGWRLCRNRYRSVQFESRKVDIILRGSVFDMEQRNSRNLYYTHRAAIRKLVDLLRCHAVLSDADVAGWVPEFCKKFSIEAPYTDASFLELVEEAYYYTLSTRAQMMDYADQVFVPVLDSIQLPRFDMVFVDEGQDMNPVQIELVRRMAAVNGTRVVAVADRHQAIYGFRGADLSSVDNIIAAVEAVELPLSICYRCPVSVVEEAKRIVPQIEPSETAPVGQVRSIKQADFGGEVQPGDFVLCRLNAPLVQMCFELIKSRIPARMRGRDIGNNLWALLRKIGRTMRVREETLRCTEIEDIRVPFNDYLAAEYMRRMSMAEDEQDMDAVVSFLDRMKTLKILLSRCSVVGDLDGELAALNLQEECISDKYVDDSAVMCSSVHKAKGMEAPRVFVLRPDLMPLPWCQSDWQRQQELNLKYVAITRAQEELVWVHDSFSAQAGGKGAQTGFDAKACRL